MKERQPKQSNKAEQKRIAVPIPEGMIDPEAVEKALADFAAAVREDKLRPREPQKLSYFGPLDQKI